MTMRLKLNASVFEMIVGSAPSFLLLCNYCYFVTLNLTVRPMI